MFFAGDRIISSIDQALDVLVFQDHFAEDVLQVAGERSVLFQTLFRQMCEVRGNQGHVDLIGGTLNGEISQQSDQLCEQCRG